MNAEEQNGTPAGSLITRLLRDLPIRVKFMLVSMAAMVAVLAAASAILIAHEWVQSRAALARHAETLATVVGNNCTAALTFMDPDVASETLGALQHEPAVLHAAVFDRNQHLFAAFTRKGSEPPPTPEPPTRKDRRFHGNTLSLATEILLDGQPIGHIFVLLSTQSVNDVLSRYLATMLVVLAAALASGILLTWHLQMLVVAPLIGLADTARKVAREQDYSVRMQCEGHDEVSRLVDAFNTMLDRIAARDAKLQQNARLLEEYHERLRKLAAELVVVEERERRRLATDLHDSVCQTLAVAKLRLLELRSRMPDGSAGEELDKACGLVNEATLEARTLIGQLSPKLLYDVGIEAAMENLAEQFHTRFGIEVAVHDDGRPKPVGDDLRALLFRSAQEFLVNAVKHGKATRADVFLRRTGDRVELTVMDNGSGFAAPQAEAPCSGTQGFGLFSIRERVKHVGGVLTVDSEPGEGTEILLSVPFIEDVDGSRAR
jgi:signal transduction histidine kinase